MDINIKPTAQVTYDVGLQSVTLTVQFVGMDEAVDYVKDARRASEKIREMIYRAVVDWDITSDGQAVPCIDENKKLYMPHIIGREHKDGGATGWKLLEFVQNPDNFLKN